MYNFKMCTSLQKEFTVLVLCFCFQQLFNAKSSYRISFDISFRKNCIKVPLKRSFFARGTEKMVPVSESPSYPGSHLCEVFLLRKGGKIRGPRKTVLLSESPSYPRSHLTGVYCRYNDDMSYCELFP